MALLGKKKAAAKKKAPAKKKVDPKVEEPVFKGRAKDKGRSAEEIAHRERQLASSARLS